MRFDTQNAASYLVWNLHHSDSVKAVRDDGSDIIHIELKTGKQVMVHLYERPVTQNELRDTLLDNQQGGYYTLFIFWADLLLPGHGVQYQLDDWMLIVSELYGGLIYGYEVMGRQAYFFPILFEGAGQVRHVLHGDIVDFHTVSVKIAESTVLGGDWWIASFEAAQQNPEAEMPKTVFRNTIQDAYALFGVDALADEAQVKRIYRKLARKHHPDAQGDAANDTMMTQINLAYEKLLKRLRRD